MAEQQALRVDPASSSAVGDVAAPRARVRLPVVTTSAMRTFHRCPKEYEIEYVLGYRPVIKEEALRFGTLVHAGLESWWRAPRDEALDRAIEALRPLAADEFDLVRAGALLQGYDARWGDEPMRVLGVEVEFRAPLVNPNTGMASRTYDLAGKLDVVVEHEGLTKLIEHKTSSADLSPGSSYWRRLMLDPQISNYFAGGKAAGFDIAECIYDVIGKSQLRVSSVPITDEFGTKIVLDKDGQRVRTARGKWRETSDAANGFEVQTRPETPEEFRQRLTNHIAENPDRYYQRGTVVRLEQEASDAAYDAWHTARLIREATLANRFPRNPSSCERYGRMCTWFDHCTRTSSLDDTARYRRTDNVNEELSSEAA